MRVADKTQTIVTTNCSTTGGAAPFLFLRSQELLHTIGFDGCEVLQKTHSEQFLISSVKMQKVFTGILGAFGTKGYGMFAKTFALFFQERTVFIPGATACTVGYANPFLSQIMVHRKGPTADVTVHTAGCDKVL